MEYGQKIASKDDRPCVELPKRRLLIVPELEQFATDGTVLWNRELVDTFLAWSDFGNPESRFCRMALVSQTLTTENVRSEDGRSFSELLEDWSRELPEVQQRQLGVWYSNKSSVHPGVGTYSDCVGEVRFFTREHFDTHRNAYRRTPGTPDASAWYHIFQTSLRSHDVRLTHVYNFNHPSHWLEVGQVRPSEAYGHIVMLERTEEGELDPRLFKLK